MSSIDRVMSEAEQLFGLERSQIFFDLLAAELCQFGSAGAISEFVPNMAESTVRQNVISFFEKSWETINRQMELLLRCPNSTILQQLPVQKFTSLMESVIKSSLNTTTKGKEELSLEGNMYTMVDLKEFKKSVAEEIPEDVLNRLRLGDEMVVCRFVDTRLERHQPSDRRENGDIHSIYFPSDCRLFIYIPTEYGSYWHRSDMQRDNRIRRYSI
ncbi:hypothetical protein ACJMK2_029114 [Sinanodonta woodiana]|uniref:Uncharacterized protein n=1 Tax=Sinanodonta woodiana TaxID=1069815 RepID=A0ABD3XD77_SINWO